MNGELQNDDLLAITSNICTFFNLVTISDYARNEGITYNGVKSRIEAGKIKEVIFFGAKFVIDNE